MKSETLKKLQTAVIATQEKKDAAPGTPSRRGGYGLGWGEVEVEWATKPLVHHGGSNGKDLAHIWLDPDRDLAMVMMTNISGQRADEAFRALAPELYKQFAKK